MSNQRFAEVPGLKGNGIWLCPECQRRSVGKTGSPAKCSWCGFDPSAKPYPVFVERGPAGIGFWQCDKCHEIQRGTPGEPASCTACGYDPLFEDNPTPAAKEMIHRTKEEFTAVNTAVKSTNLASTTSVQTAKVLVQFQIPVMCSCPTCRETKQAAMQLWVEKTITQALQYQPVVIPATPTAMIKFDVRGEQ